MMVSMRSFRGWTGLVMTLVLLGGLFSFLAAARADAATVFPGIFPSLTQSGAEAFQQQVNQGNDLWLLDARQTSLMLAEQLVGWPANSGTTLQSGGGAHDSSAVVVVNNAAVDRGSITVTLGRLDGNVNGGIWIVTNVVSPNTSISTPQPLATLPQSSSNVGGQQPYTVKGTGSGFEGVVGNVTLMGASYNTITTAQAKTSGTGSTAFSAPLIYSAQSQQDGLVVLLLASAAGGGTPHGAVMVKVVIG